MMTDTDIEKLQSSLKTTIDNNQELNRKFANVDSKVSDAFGDNGVALAADLGKVCESAFNSEVKDQFSKNVKIKLSAFVEDQIPSIIKNTVEAADSVTKVYGNM